MRRASFMSFFLAITTLAAWPSYAEDWPEWRGPQRAGHSLDTGLLTSWSENGPELIWKATGIGAGYSTVTIADGRVFTMGLRDGKGELIALDKKDGKELWATTIDDHDPNSTPVIDGETVFALGWHGDLVAVDAVTGKERWRRHLAKELGGKTQTNCGFSESPLIDGEKVICTPGASDAIVAALKKRTGELIWKTKLPDDVGEKGADGASYSSIVISEACGVRHYVALVGRGALGISPHDGRVLWTYNRIANEHANVATPVVNGDYIFCTTAYQTGSVLLKLVKEPSNKGKLRAEEVYFLKPKVMQNHHGGVILVGDHIYAGHGHNKGFPLCIDFLTGKEAWRPGRGPGAGSAALLYADGHIYFRYENGVIALIEANPEKYVLKSTFTLPNAVDKSWAHPVVVDGRLYLREPGTLFCYRVKE